METKAVIEVLIIEVDVHKKIRKPLSVGFSVLPLFGENLPISVEIFKGSPRDVMRKEEQRVPSGSILYFDFKVQPAKKFDALMNLIPDNILVGFNDDLPGVVGSKLPLIAEDITAKCKLAQLKTVFAHNVRISSMNEIEQAF